MRTRIAIGLALMMTAPAQAAPARCVQVDEDFGPRGEPAVRAEVVARGLEVPWGLAFLPDGSWLITERPGRIRRVVDGKLVARPVAKLDVARGGEGGLLGLALHPAFARNRLFYVYVTVDTPRGARNQVERWRLSRDASSATRDRVIFDDIAAARFHDGGRIAFGPDGMLYVGTGDAGHPERAQAWDSPNGKILRLTPDGGVPRDNPRPNSPVFVRGVRNVEGFAWRADGSLVIADHGPSGELGRRGHDEVSVARAGDNLGWPTIYGCQRRAGMITPALTWKDAVPPGGAVIYTGDAFPAWRGDLLIGTLGSTHLHRVRLDRAGRVVAHAVYLTDHGRLRTVAIGPDRALYVMTSNCDGRATCPAGGDAILRITPSERASTYTRTAR